MTSKGSQILSALQTRLQLIKVANGYQTTVKSVNLIRQNTLNLPEADLPLIEIIKESERYDHDLGPSYWANPEIILYLVARKSTTDQQMEDFLQDIRQCLYGGAVDATGNTGMTLGGLVQSIELVDSVADLNMIDSHRVYLLKIRLRSHRITYRD